MGPVRLRVRHGGRGPAVLLVHGHPRTHTTWYEVAPRLVAAGFRVVCPDLRGYGRSTVPPDEPGHAQASKRAMAGDLVRLMRALGHDRFHAVGHDRGAYVVQRLALDHPGALDRVVILGAVPIGEALRRCDARFAAAWWHWFFMGQPAPLAERLIAADSDAWYRLGPDSMGADNHADTLACLRDPSVQHGMCEDYRAGLGVDRDADDSDRSAGRRIQRPLLVLWGTGDDLAGLYDDDVLGVWRPWAADLRGHGIDSGHHMAEEVPELLAATLIDFFASEARQAQPPPGFHSVTPRMVVADAAAQVEFLRAVFAATGDVPVGRPAEIRIGDSVVMVAPAGERDVFPAFLYVYVDDPDGAYRRALAAGAESLEPPLDTPYGDRRAMVRDPFGNVFQLARRRSGTG